MHESKSHNYRLVEFLTLPQNLRKLLSYSNGKISVDDDRFKLRCVGRVQLGAPLKPY